MKGHRYLIFLIAILFSLSLQSQTTTQLTVRGFSEGYYRPSTGKMVAKIDSINYPMICDTGFIQIIDTSTMQAVFCTDAVIKTDGYGFCNVPAYLHGQYVKVSIKFRNSFHMVSLNVVRMTGNAISVDLTIPQNVCCSFDSTHGVAKAYSGDLNDDGAIDGSDFLILDPEITSQVTGYSNADLNGDGIVDIQDFYILDPNILMGRSDVFLGACAVNGIEDNQRVILNVFPNPFIREFNVTLDRPYRKINYSLLDATGRVQQEGSESDVSTIQLNNEFLPAGIYYLRVSADGEFQKDAVLLKVPGN